MADSGHDYSTVLAHDATFKGELVFESAAKVLGRIEGSIQSKGKLLIADGANCKATVRASDVSIEGLVEGNVEAVDRIEVKSKGVINGDITASRMSVAEGASIDGHCRIGNGQVGGKSHASAEVKPGAQAQHASAGKK